MIRKISMMNQRNNLIDFSDREKFFLYDVSGLGIDLDNKFDDFGVTNILRKQTAKAASLKAKLLVGQNSPIAYEVFVEMFEFLNSPPFKMIYETDAGLYYRDCVLSKLTKGDMEKGRVFIEDIAFDFTGFYYQWKNQSYSPVENIDGNGKIYGWSVYPYNYESDINGVGGVFQIDNNSLLFGLEGSSPVEVTIKGPCENPSWEITNGSKILQSDAYNLAIDDGYKLVVSSFPGEQACKLIAPDGTSSNVYQQQDTSKTNFVSIPIGQSFFVSHNFGKNVEFKFKEYRGVT